MQRQLKGFGNAAVLSILLAAGGACGPLEEASDETAETKDPAYIDNGERWTTSTIPVCWEGNGWSQEKQWVRAFVEDTYETLADFKIDFTSWAVCGASNGNGIRIQIVDTGSLVQQLGNDLAGNSNGMQLDFNYTTWRTFCNNSRNQRLQCLGISAAHEFAHALSLAHEQNRSDTPGWCNQQQGSNGDTTVGAWDIDSITNYCNPQLENGGVLSMGDIAGLAYMYAPSPARGKSIFYRDNASHIREVYGPPSGWVPVNLSTLTGAPPAVGPPDSVFHQGAQRVYYRGSSGSIHSLHHTPSLGWSYFALSANIPNAVAAAGEPKGAGIQAYSHVFYRGTDNHIHQFFFNGSSWTKNDLSALTGAPVNAAGDPAVYTMANSMHIIYRGTDNKIHALDWEIDRSWRYTNLTGSIPWVANAAGNPAAMSIGFFQYVYFRGSDNHIYQLGNDYMNGDTWTPTDLFLSVSGEVNAASDPTVHNRSEYRNVFYRGTDNHMHELFFDGNTTWSHNDLTVVTNGPAVNGQPTSVVVGQAQHVFYQGEWTNVIQELWHTPSLGWQKFNLGANVGTPAPIGRMAVHMH